MLAEALKNADISMIFFGTKGSTEPIDLWAPNESWDSGSKDEEENTEEMPEDKGGKGAKHASVDKGTRDGRKKMYSSNPCITQDMDESINVEELPPVPTRGYTRYYAWPKF